MRKKAKVLFMGDYFPGWQASMNLCERLSHITTSSYLSYSDRTKMIKKPSNLMNKLLMPYYSYNAKVNAQFPLELLQSFFKKSDLNCINLETSLSNAGYPIQGKHFNLRCEPFYIDGLLSSNINFVILANNHILDYGEESLKETIKLLNKYNIGFSGIKPEGQPDEQNIVIQNVNGIKIGFLSYVDPSIIDPSPEVFFDYNIYPYKLNAEQIIIDITRAKKDTDIIIVNVHWGDEWSHMENMDQIDLAHKMIDSGATVVVGHHPHVIQGIEKYKNGIIAYSLGNLFMHLGDISGIRCKKSFLFGVELSELGLESFEIYPISHNKNGQPYLDGCIDTENLDLGNKNNKTLRNSLLSSNIKNANVTFLKDNQQFKSKWNEEFKIDRVIYDSAWSKNSAYVAYGKEFSGKNLKPSAICHSGEYNEISIIFPNFKISENLNFYFGYPDWFDHENHYYVKISIKLGKQIFFHGEINSNGLNNITIDSIDIDNGKDLIVTLKRDKSHFTCLFGIEKLE